MSILLLIIGLIIGAICVYVPISQKLKTHEIENNDIRRANKQAMEEAEALGAQLSELCKEYEIAYSKVSSVKDQLAAYQESINNQNAVLQKALEDYADTLESRYALLEQNWDKSEKELNEQKIAIQEEVARTISEELNKLNKLKETRAALVAASVREKEIKEKLDFYCLKVDSLDLADIDTLSKIKCRLNKPRILSMLIWQTYYQKPMTQLCNNILGTGVVTGIYKITNQLTNEVYIGQARDMASRWKEHAKCGLDIDRPQGNKLYQAMVDEGLQNFSWELLEKCPTTQLNEKEKYYIEVYQAYEFGYNSTKGNK